MSDTQQPTGDAGAAPTAPGAISQPSPAAYPAPMERHRRRTGWVGWVRFACVMMILIGVFQAIAGLVAIFEDRYYLVTSSGLIVQADYAVWGWVHLAFGALLIIAGLAGLRGALWARIVGVALAGLSALANLAFLAAYPLWSTLIIAMDVLVIYALTVHGSELAD